MGLGIESRSKIWNINEMMDTKRFMHSLWRFEDIGANCDSNLVDSENDCTI